MKLLTVLFSTLFVLAGCYEVDHEALIQVKGSTKGGFQAAERNGELCADVYYKLVNPTDKNLMEAVQKEHVCTDEIVFHDGQLLSDFPFKLTPVAKAYDVVSIENISLSTQYDTTECLECAVTVANNSYVGSAENADYSPTHVRLDLNFELKETLTSQRWNSTYADVVDGCRKLEYNSAIENCLQFKVTPQNSEACAKFDNEADQNACIKNATTPFPQNEPTEIATAPVQ